MHWKTSLDIVGGGNSPVLEYDRAVVQAAVEYLAKDHDKPQCIVVGLYGPHFPYVAPPELYSHYLDCVALPQTRMGDLNYGHIALEERAMPRPDDVVRRARAAYYGMIEEVDGHVGTVFEAWANFLKKDDRPGTFLYISDHGDHCGDRNLYGKHTFFEQSARIPMLACGNGVAAGRRWSSPVSIMDLAPTFCELAKSRPLPEQDGRSLVNSLIGQGDNEDRAVFSELLEHSNVPLGERAIPGRMIRRGDWKLIHFHGRDDDLLFNLATDPLELVNVLAHHPDVAASLKSALLEDWKPESIIANYSRAQAHFLLLNEWERATGFCDGDERWRTPECARHKPEIE